MAPNHSGKRKKKRTLVVIDGEALREGEKYDFSFLEGEKRLEIWFFYKERIHHSFRLRRDFTAQNVLLPRYEEDLHLYILKRVCYELGRREGRYKKAIFIGAHHPVWEGLVQFLRERGLTCTHVLASDYRVERTDIQNLIRSELAPPSGALTGHPLSETQKTSTPKKAQGPKPEAPSKASEQPMSEELKKLFKRKGRASEAHMRIYQQVLNALRTLPAGASLTKADFRKMLKSMNIATKANLPGKNLNYFIGRLQEAGFVSIEGDKIIPRLQS